MFVSSVLTPPVRFLKSVGTVEGSDSSVILSYTTEDTLTGSLNVKVIKSRSKSRTKVMSIGGTSSGTRVPEVT